MSLPTPSFECPSGARRRSIIGALCGCVVLPACATGNTSPPMPPQPSTATDVGAITSLTLERDCSGCLTGSRLELRRDGTVVAVVTGKARRGTQDQVSRARLAPGDFDTLARAVLDAGFFTMAETYEEPGLQDGAWATLVVTRGTVPKQVFRREDAGPPALKALEVAIVTLQARLVFVPNTR
ncbi:MAG: hypothetical protein Q7U73_03515 [Rubrivivax sp.]|nr:hypothetical protein [Rubrivivax sp.]